MNRCNFWEGGVVKNLLSLGLLALGFCGVASGQTFRAITSEGPWGDYEAFPDVCRMANGDLYVVFYAGYGHVSNPRDDLPRGGAVYGLRSSDEGKTWSDPILVVDTPEDDRDPHVTQLANGDLLASFFDSVYYTEDGKRKRRAETYVVRSADGGKTWGDPEVVTTPYQDTAGIGRRIFVSGPVAQLKGPHVVLPIYYEKVAGHYITSVVHSEDFGHTWTRHSPVDTEASLAFSYGFCEASIARVSDGRLIILMRPGMHQAYSSDEGRTWSKATRLPHRGDAPTAMLTSKNVLLVAHRHPGTAVTISVDDGASWGRPHQIDTVGGAYPGLVELKDGSILCIYYEEGKASSIRQAIFTVEPRVRLENLHQRWPVPPPGDADSERVAHSDDPFWNGLTRESIQLGHILLIVKGSKGVAGCSYLNIDTFERFGEACAIIPAGDFDKMLDAKVTAVTSQAKALGVDVGMPGREALELLR